MGIHARPKIPLAGIYSHMGGKLVVVVEIEGAADQEGIAKEIAISVAAENPDFLKPEEIPAHVLAREEEIACQGEPQYCRQDRGREDQGFYRSGLSDSSGIMLKDNSVTVQQFLELAQRRSASLYRSDVFWRWKVGQ